MTAPVRPDVTVAGESLYESLGPLTIQDEELGWPLLRYCDAAGQLLQKVDDLARDTDAGPGWSQIVDPDRAPAAALPWLGQFVGARVDVGRPVLDQRTEVKAETGFERGTAAAILAAAQRYLTGDQRVRIIERYAGEPYAFAVVVFGWQVVPQSYAELSGNYPTYLNLSEQFLTYEVAPPATDELRRAISLAKPAGLQLSIIVAAGAEYADLSDTYATYADLSARWPTYEPMLKAGPGA